MEYSPSDSEFAFNFGLFLKFLMDNNILQVIVAAILSDKINDVTDSIVNDLVMPIINRDGDGDGEEDIKGLSEMKYTFWGMTFRIGKVIYALIKFFIVAYLIFIVYKLILASLNN